MEIEQINESIGQKLVNLLKVNADNQYVQCPCKVLAVNGNYVDVLPIINDDEENQPIYDVKIKIQAITCCERCGCRIENIGWRNCCYSDRSDS